jgi:tRNA-2-methylthio-N6-dimethylallyladenosine synthase
VQNAISLELTLPLAGKDLEVLVEGPSKSAQKRAANGEAAADEIVQLVGRSTHDHIVVFDGPRALIGQILPVRIEKVDAFTLFGRIVDKNAALGQT